jgi:hypothetical protein
MTACCRVRILVFLVRQLFTKVFEGNLNAVVIEFLVLGSKLITATGMQLFRRVRRAAHTRCERHHVRTLLEMTF